MALSACGPGTARDDVGTDSGTEGPGDPTFGSPCEVPDDCPPIGGYTYVCEDSRCVPTPFGCEYYGNCDGTDEASDTGPEPDPDPDSGSYSDPAPGPPIPGCASAPSFVVSEIAVPDGPLALVFVEGTAGALPSLAVATSERIDGYGMDGALLYEALPSLDAGETIANVASADFDGDGRADVLYATADRVGVVFPGEDGVTTQWAPMPVQTSTLAVADVDGDGLADIVGILDGSVFVVSNLGGGAWSDAAAFAQGERVAVGDLDGESPTDVAILSSAGLQRWRGGPAPVLIDENEVPGDRVFVGEFTAKGTPNAVFVPWPDGEDAAISMVASGGSWRVYTFTAPGTVLGVGDVEGDGAADVVRVHDGAQLSTVRGGVSGLVCESPLTSVGVPVAWAGAVLGDLDLDGDDEIAALGDGVVVLLSRG
jgi:hypothetical protein